MISQQAGWEIFVFEYYLILLHEIEPRSDEENEKIKIAKSNIHSLLTKLYKVADYREYDSTMSPAVLKQNHSERCNYNLIHAAENNDGELLDASIAAGANVNFSYIGKCALTYAVTKINYAIAERLIKANANVNIVVNGRTPLMVAVDNNDLAMVKLLVAAGADVNKRIKLRETALYLACLYNRVSLELLQFLLSIPNIQVNDEFPIHRYRTALSVALSNMKISHDSSKVQCLLKAGVIKIDRDFITAIDAGLDAVRLMLDAGYICTEEVLSAAITDDADAGVIDLLISSNGAGIEDAKRNLIKYSEYTELMFYTAIGNIVEVKRLLAPPIENMDAAKNDYNAALLMAAKFGRTDIARLLLVAGANINHTDERRGATPLMLAAQFGHANTVKLFLEYNADVNKQTSLYPKGKTAIFMATEAGHSDIVETLLSIDSIDITIKTEAKESADEKGLKCKNRRIADAYELKIAKPSITDLEVEIKKQITHFRDNGKSLVGIGNNKKANKIQEAFDRAVKCKLSHFSMQKFLNYKENDKESIIDALSYHRIGFFGPPSSRLQIEEFVNHYKMPRKI